MIADRSKSGVNLEWRMKVALRLFALSGAKPFHQSTPEEIRARDNAAETWVSDLILGPRLNVPQVLDRPIKTRHGEIPMRVYTFGQDNAGKPRPIIFFIHGGGFVVGNMKMYDRFCRRLAQVCEYQIVLFEYHKAPEYKFPIGVEDCWDTLLWLAKNGSQFDGDPNQIFVVGDSAGGNLSAVMTQMSRDQNGPPLKKQVLIYPAVDSTMTYRSEEIYAETPILGAKDMHWFGAHYLSTEAERQDPRCSPLLGDLSNLPPALILNAEYDPLVDQGKTYAKALEAAGVDVRYKLYPRQLHGFLNLAGVSSQTKAAFLEIGRFIKEN